MLRVLKKIIKGIVRFIWSIFLNGLLAILPITLTVSIFFLSFKILTAWVQPLHDFFERHAELLPFCFTCIPYSELILAFLGLLVIGALMKFFILESIIHRIEHHILERIPLFSPVYSAAKRLVHAFSPRDRVSFKTVVMVEFPRKEMYSVGFLTGDMKQDFAPHQSNAYATVFIPTTPNPTTGYFLIVPKDELIVLDISRQEAMALIISGGIIQPDSKKE